MKRCFGTHDAICDGCKKDVDFSDGYYICKDCHSCLGKFEWEIISRLNNFPRLRGLVIRYLNKEN